MPTVAELLNPAPAQPPPAVAASGGANPFDHFDAPGANPFDHFDAPKGGGVLANLAQGASEGIQFNGGLIRDAILNPRAIYDRAANMASQVFGDKPQQHIAPTPGDLLSLPADRAAAKQSASVVAATPAERIARATGAGATGAVVNPEGTVAQMLAGAAAGAGAGGLSEAAPDNLKPVAALAGGALGFVVAHKAVTAKFGPKVADAVAQTPREVAIEPDGKLTEDGKEIAAQTGIHPDQVKAAYDHFDEVQARTANDNPNLPPAESSAVAVGDGLTRPPPEEPVTGAPQEQPPAAEAPGAQPPPETPPLAAARLAEAQSEGVSLSRGEATQDFTVQEAENTLRKMGGTAESVQARDFKEKQQQQIADAVDRFKSALGNTEATAEERGAQVQDALRTLRDQGKAGVSALYKHAIDLAQSFGEAGSNLLKLDTGPILARLRELFIDEGLDESVRRPLKQWAAKYGLIGHDPTTVEGETTVKLRDNTGQPSGKQTFTGPVEPLTIANAESFRQKINSLFAKDTTHEAQTLKPLIDDAVQQAVERAVKDSPGGVGSAFKAARAGHQQHVGIFKARDIVQDLVSWKKGTRDTPVISPDAVLSKILGPGPDSVTSLKKVRAVLLSSATDQSKAAWNAIQAHAVAKVFDKALVLNASADGPVISGAKLNTAIQAFGVDKLKVLLPKDEFDQLMKLNRIIRNATVPIEGTVNRSGSAYTLMNFIGKQGVKLASVARFIPGSHIVGGIADAATHIVKSGQQGAKNAKTLKGIREYDLTQAANEDAKAQAQTKTFIRDFITTARDPQILAPILAASSTQSKKDPAP